MGEVTAISWCDHTFNPWIGCTKVSPACDGCYAEAMMDKRYGRVKWGAPGQGAGTRERTSKGNWSKPRAWDRKAKEAGVRPFVFCSSLADVFDNQVPTEWREDLFDLIHETPSLVWLLLTKRPQNIFKLTEAAGGLPANIALGTTIEDQQRADINVPALVLCGYEPLFFFVSCEPLLGPIDLTNICPPDVGVSGANFFWRTSLRPRIGWVITGGETDQGGHKARPTHPAWFRSLRDQCAANGVAYHHKQNGEWQGYGAAAPTDAMGNRGLPCEPRDHHDFADGETVFRVGKSRSGRLLDGIEHNERPMVA